MGRHLTSATAVTFLALLANSSYAQPVVDDTIVVTGSRTRLDAHQIGSAISVVSAEQIEAGQMLLAKDILQDIPGVQISNDRPGAVTSVSIRGADNNQVLVLLDGVELGDPSLISTQFQFDHLNASDIERIEVLRGNQSSLYGSDAIGGVINIITRRPASDGLRVTLDAEAGSYGMRRVDASVDADTGMLDYRLSVNSYSADGPSLADPNAGPADEEDSYERVGFTGQLGVQFSPGLRFEVFGFAMDSDTDLDGTGQDATFAPFVAKDEAAAALKLIGDSGNDRWFHELVYSQYESERTYEPGGDVFAGNKDNLRFSTSLKANELVSLAMGFDLEKEDTDQLTSFSGSFVAGNETAALFTELALMPSDDVTLTLAARRDDNERFGVFNTHRLTAAWSLDTQGPETKLRASWGTGAKAPGLYQLFDPAFGNEDLEVEESEGYDLGVDLAWAGGALLEVSYFSTDIENEIDFQWPLGYLNLGSTRAQGVETHFAMPLGNRLNWSLTYTYLDSRDRETDSWLGRPRNAATTRLTINASEKLGLTARARYRSTNEASFGGVTDSFVVLDLLGSFELSDRIEVYGRIVNLLDEDYQFEWGNATLDRSVFAGMRLRY